MIISKLATRHSWLWASKRIMQYRARVDLLYRVRCINILELEGKQIYVVVSAMPRDASQICAGRRFIRSWTSDWGTCFWCTHCAPVLFTLASCRHSSLQPTFHTLSRIYTVEPLTHPPPSPNLSYWKSERVNHFIWRLREKKRDLFVYRSFSFTVSNSGREDIISEQRIASSLWTWR